MGRNSVWLVLILLFGGAVLMRPVSTGAQEPNNPATPTPTPSPAPKKPTASTVTHLDLKNPTGEVVAEAAIIVYGGGNGRAVLDQIRRNGIERGRSTRVQSDGHSDEERYEMRFVRGASAAKDKVRIDRKTPQVEYSLIFGEGRIFGIVNGSAFTPREDATADFVNERIHSIDALLRYKENGSKINLVRKDKAQGIDVYLLDLTDSENHVTHYFISAKTFRILWLEYEEPRPGRPSPITYQRRFYDYRFAQGTLVPFRTVLLEDGKQTTETRILTVTYGAKMEDSLFQNPDQAASANP